MGATTDPHAKVMNLHHQHAHKIRIIPSLSIPVIIIIVVILVLSACSINCNFIIPNSCCVSVSVIIVSSSLWFTWRRVHLMSSWCHCIILDWCNLNSPFTGHIMVMREWRLRVSCFYLPTIAQLMDMGTSIQRGSRVVLERSSRLLASIDLSKILYNVPASIPINRNLLSLRHPPSN